MARSRREHRERCLVLETLEDRCLLSYTITDLGTLGGNTSYPFGINNADPVQVVGESNVGAFGSPFHAFVWGSANGMQDLGTLGGSTSVASAINDAGQVVGWAGTQTPFSETAFLWDSTNGLQPLGGLAGYRASRAFAINDAGQVAGWAGNSYFLDGHAVLWDGGTATDLGTINGYPSAAHGIDASAQVVGSAGPIGASHALLWENGSVQDLGSLSSWGSTAAGINHRGHVVGIVYVEPQAGTILSNPYLYTPAQGLNDLGTLDCPPGYLGFGAGAAINDHNEVVGFNGCVTAQLPLQSYNFAAVWDPGQGWQDLNSLIPPDSGWTLSEATAVNDRGQIVGYGLIQGQTHGYLLTPSSGGDAVGRSNSSLPVDPVSRQALGFQTPALGGTGEATVGTNDRRAGIPTAPLREETRIGQPSRPAASEAWPWTPPELPAFDLVFGAPADDALAGTWM